MAVREDPPAAVEEIGRGRVGPVGIVLTATVLLSLTIVLLYGFIQFWPPAPAATSTAAATTTITTTATGQTTAGTTGQAAVEPPVQFFGATWGSPDSPEGCYLVRVGEARLPGVVLV
jgi:hypothetical protein